MKWLTPESPDDTVLGNNFIFWLLRFFEAFRRVDQNYEHQVVITESYIATANDTLILANASAGNIIVTLPSQNDLNHQKKFIVIKTDSSANTVTLASADSATFLTTVTLPLSTQHVAITLIADGADFRGY